MRDGFNQFMVPSKLSIYYSFSTFMDALIIILTLVCGLYCLGLMLNTMNYIRNQTSLIEDFKKERLSKQRRRGKALTPAE